MGKLLANVAKKVQENYKERHQAKTIGQIKDFVARLGSLQKEHNSLKLHTYMAECLTKVTMSEDFNKCLEVQQSTGFSLMEVCLVR